MKFRKLVGVITFLAVAAMAARVSIDSDTFWHLAAGRWIVEHGQILRSDPFSITRMGQSWVYPGWLAQIALYGLHQRLGFLGFNLFTAVSVLIAFVLIWRIMREPVLVRGFVVILGAAASGIFWSARPQMLTFLLSAVFLVLLIQWERGEAGWRIWLLPPLMALWSNFHGGFITGILLILAFLGGRLATLLTQLLLDWSSRLNQWHAHRRQLGSGLLLLFLCTLALVVNPFGPRMLLYPFQTISLETLSGYIQEWQSPDFHQPASWPFLLMFLLVPVSWAYSGKKPQPYSIFLFLGFGGLALHAARNIALFALVAAPTLSFHLDRAVRPIAEAIGPGRQVPTRLAERLNLVAALLLTLVLVLWGGPRMGEQATQQAIDERFPVEAVDTLLALEKSGPLFHTYRWGGYILWQGYPQLKSFVDGRTDLFGDEILMEYLDVYRANSGFQEVLERYAVRWVLIEPDAPLAAAASRLDWEKTLQTSAAVLYKVDQETIRIDQ
ncbi:MAG: hypothetical protein ACLFWD_01000 [Anaerolineales bacterium]